MSSRHTIEAQIALDGQTFESETTCMWAGPHTLALTTTLPAPELAIEINSTFVGHEGVPTCATHLTLGPLDVKPAISIAQHAHEYLDPKVNSRQCVYEHWSIVLEYLGALGYHPSIDVPHQAFDVLARVEGMM